jgi:hypothetical protein
VSRTFNIITTLLLIFLAISLLSGLVWANTLFARNNFGETDFLVPWLAARTMLQNGDNPYSETAANRTRIMYYGHNAAGNEDPLVLWVPFPVELFYFPFALVDNYVLARSLWMACLEIALGALALCSLQLTGWKPGRFILPAILIFSVLWVYGFLPLSGGRAVILVALAIVGLLLALRDGRDELAGSLLVVPFFKPDIAGILVLLILWWAIYYRRGRVLAGFGMVLVLLLAISFFILPNWFIPFIRGMISHLEFSQALTPGGILASIFPEVGPRLGWVLTGVMLVILFIEWRKVRRKEFRHFLWTISLTLVCTPLLGIPVIPQDYVLLLLPLIHFLSIVEERWSRPGRWSVAGLMLLGIFFGLWLVTARLFLAGMSVTTNSVLVLVFPFLLLVGLYWMRWWAVRPPRTWSDSLP